MRCVHVDEKVDESPQKDENFGTCEYPKSFFVLKLWPFEIEIPRNCRSHPIYIDNHVHPERKARIIRNVWPLPDLF